MSDSLEDLRARVDEVFREVAADVEALGNRLRPSALTPPRGGPGGEAGASAGRNPLDAAIEIAGRLRRTAEGRPVEATAIALGAAAVLMALGRRRRHH